MKRTNIAIIGAGAVGSTIAYTLILKDLPCNIMLIDKDAKRCHGEVFDLLDTTGLAASATIDSESISAARTADIIIIAAGIRQKPNEDRVALFQKNKETVQEIAQTLGTLPEHAIVIVVSNPLDALATIFQQETGMNHAHIFGTGTFLDTQRLRELLSKKLHIAQHSINAYVLGEHGDSQFAAWSCANIAGIPLTQFINADELNTIAQTAKNKAYEIIDCKSATYWGIATCTAAICRTIIYNQQRITPLSVYNPDYDIYISAPAVLGSNGIERTLTLPLSDQELQQYNQSAQTIKQLLQ